MKIKVSTDNLINLVSNLLIRMRTEELLESGNLQNDLSSFVSYLEKFSGDKNEVLFDKNFITSKEEHIRLNEVINPRIPEIKVFKELVESLIATPTDIETNSNLIKEHLRKIAAALISLKNQSNY